MKIITCCLLIIIANFNLHAEPPEKRGWKELSLKGKVKSCIEISLKKDGSVYYKRAYRFDEKGNAIEETVYSNTDGNVMRLIKFKYDINGNIVEKSALKPDNTLVYKHSYKYNTDGIFIEDTEFDRNNAITSVVKNANIPDSIKNKYNKRGMLLENNTYWKNKSERKIFLYDSANNLIERKYFSAKDSLIFKTTHKYDEKGQTIEDIYYKSADSINYKYTYAYDEKGNNTERIYYKSNGSINYHYFYKYDEKGNRIEEDSYKDGNLSHKYVYKLDDEGNITEEIRYYKPGIISSKTTQIFEYYP